MLIKQRGNIKCYPGSLERTVLQKYKADGANSQVVLTCISHRKI